jgi:BolA family transcriptional regulator, general stress-responsive regulator
VSTVERMRERLAALHPERVEILDESAQHAGHEGAKSGGGHFRLTIVSKQFVGLPPMARHRMIYGALGDLLQREIHALAIRAESPDQF